MPHKDYLLIDSLICKSPIVPIAIINDKVAAVNLARTLLSEGIGVLEVAIRTENAISCIASIKDQVRDITIGAGTILNYDTMTAAIAAGADFLVSPGTTNSLLKCAETSPIPLLPGASTVSEIITLMEHGYRRIKFFPAESCGGINFLKSIYSIFPDLKFCPTGGVSAENANDYLSLPNVLCIGGSWLVPQKAIASGEWNILKKLATAAKKIYS